MFASNLGLTLALMGMKTVLIDMNMGMRSLDLYLGVQDRAIFDISDVVMRTCEPEKALLQSDVCRDLSLLPAHQGSGWDEISEGEIEALIDHLEKKFDCVIIDAPPGCGRVIDRCASCTDMTIIVSTPDYASLRDADALEDHLIRTGVFERRYVVNRIMPQLVKEGIEPDLPEIDRRFRCEMLGTILDDDNIRASTNIGVPIVAKRDTYIAANFDRIAARLMH